MENIESELKYIKVNKNTKFTAIIIYLYFKLV